MMVTLEEQLNLIQTVREKYADEGSRKSKIAKEVLQQNPSLQLSEAQNVFMQGMDMTRSGAQTYYYKYRQNDRSVAEKPEEEIKEEKEIAANGYPTELLQQALYVAAESAKYWYESRAALVGREDFESKGGLDDDGTGAVYSYFGENDKPLYVGITSGKVKNRIYVKTSRHVDKDWWGDWKSMRFAQIGDDTDRQLLEYLLIVAYKPSGNSKPKGKEVKNFLTE